jgi:hypothetical protein
MDKATENIERIRADLSNTNSGLFNELATSVGHYTAAFVILPETPTQSPRPCGAGTLIAINNTRYFLTASHVWTELKKSKNIGVTISPTNNCFQIPTKDLSATGPPKPAAEDEGPDIVLLEIPTEKLGEIAARKSFYRLEPPWNRPPMDVKCIEVRILMGSPGEAATITAATQHTPKSLDLTIQAIMADSDSETFTKDDYDYIDSREISGAYGFPYSYRGFSGGGLWRVQIYHDPDTGERVSRHGLEGMAFHQSGMQDGHRIIRCHGRRSIDKVKGMLQSK